MRADEGAASKEGRKERRRKKRSQGTKPQPHMAETQSEDQVLRKNQEHGY